MENIDYDGIECELKALNYSEKQIAEIIVIIRENHN